MIETIYTTFFILDYLLGGFLILYILFKRDVKRLEAEE